jgi:hypothetical protein
MFTIKKLEAGSMLAVSALVLVLVAAGFPRVSQSDRANDAWSERLTKQAEQLQEEARAARAASAWSQRLNALAAINSPREGSSEQAAVGMSDRAIVAWADRLTSLAEYYAAQK